MLRTLYIAHILHPLADMGSLAEEVKKAFVAQKGLRAWQAHQRQIEQFWKELEGKLSRLQESVHTNKIYQDGLPAVAEELVKEIVARAAAQGSANYKLLLKLQEKGAQVMGTEDPQLLQQEHARAHQGLAAPGEHDALLAQRDQFMAQQIDDTLKPGETGLLFIGRLHRVGEKLQGKDINIIIL